MTFDLVKIEKDILDFWQKNKIYEKYLLKNKNAQKKWSFLDGPITANNPMGVHHAWGRTYKDLFCRFKTMQGYRQRYQNGFDCQGLWVEVEVEKDLGFKNKKEIEKYGLANFVEKCKARVKKYSCIQTEQSKRLGYFMDWENSYYTMSAENNYAIWHFLKVCQEKGYLYKGRDAVPWCPRCGTAISQHEISTEEYQNIVHKACYLKFPISNFQFPKTSFLVWTTTPWTLLANVAVAVHPKLGYALIEENGEKLILLEKLAKKVSPKAKIVNTFLGKELIGLEYTSIFDELPAVKKEIQNYHHRVIDGRDLVNEEEGTGLVHLAPGAGAEDFALAKKEKLPIIVPINDTGIILGGFGKFSGNYASAATDLVFEELKKKQALFRVEEYTHRYPTCWRCKTELLFRVVDEWYLAIDHSPSQNPKLNETLRQQMMEIAKRIKWLPQFGLKLELDWLKNMDNWLISKKRYWGLALPIWECRKCGQFEVLGSYQELKEKAIEGWDKFEGQTPHRPWIDEIKIKCSKCGSRISRIQDVGNPWLDAGIVAISTLPEDWFPADFITESFPGQFRNWFYSLIAMTTVLKNEPPFLTVLGHASLRDEKGEEMHKSKGNAIWFDEAAGKSGVEVMRWLYLAANPFENLKFGWNALDEIKRKYILILLNIVLFYEFNFSGRKEQKIKLSDLANILDRWIVSRLQETIKVVSDSLEKFDPATASHELEVYIIEDLSKWYLRRSRKRQDGEFSRVFKYILLETSKLLAPFLPFISESIYQKVKDSDAPESVHLCDWPQVNDRFISKNILSRMKNVRLVCEMGHSQRDEAKIPVRQPLAKITLSAIFFEKEYTNLIAEELNVKKVVLRKEKQQEMRVILDTTITEELKTEGQVRELIRKIQDFRKKIGCQYDEKIEITLKGGEGLVRKFGEQIEKATKTKIVNKNEVKNL